jgi:hypothetical protein
MNPEYMIGIVFGHLAGDYLLQPKEMALKKSEKGLRGLLWCLVHCVVYTLCVCLFTWKWNPLFAGLIFLSHFPIDRWSLGGWWLKMIKGRTFEDAYNNKGQYREFDIAFTSIVYTVVDNTLHLIPMYLIGKWF